MKKKKNIKCNKITQAGGDAGRKTSNKARIT